ncbi:MAG TPA: MFS transporter [Candidatus Limnocylindria bacterium]|nr:MFS transporter [Candidatus Limnocylindria bacterium]
MTWGAFRHFNYRMFFAGQLVSQSGRWMQGLAQSWLVLDLTGSAAALGAVTVAQFSPIILLSLFSGPIADRFPKQRFLMATQAVAALQAVVFAALVITGNIQVWEIYVLAAVVGTFNALDNPTRQSFANELVDRAEVPSAVGLGSTVTNAARILGPSAGGVIIATWGTGWCFAITAAGFLVSFASLAALRRHELRPAVAPTAGRMHVQVVDGLRYVLSVRELLVPLALLAFIGSIGYNWLVTLPLLARYTFAVGPTGLGALNAAMGLGSLVGGLLVASFRALRAIELSRIALAFSLALAGLAAAPLYAIALVLLTIAGCLGVFYSAGVNASVQLRSRPEYRGRVIGVFFLVWAGGTPVGGALTGYLAAIWDVRVALAVNAALCLAASVVSIVYLTRRAVPAPATGVAPAPIDDTKPA